ncbi:MAG: Uma2 family endonuclease [Bacteroidota bacterium]
MKRRYLSAVKYLNQLLGNYVQWNDLGEVDGGKAMISLSRNDYEPDICFWLKEKTDHFHADLMMHPAPDLIVEVLFKSTAYRDRGSSFRIMQHVG